MFDYVWLFMGAVLINFSLFVYCLIKIFKKWINVFFYTNKSVNKCVSYY